MIQSLHYFPCVNAFTDLLQESVLAFDGEYQFKRSSFRNRTIIASAAGPITLSIPVVGGRNVKLSYKDVEIDYNNNWQRDHFRTLSTVYGSSPFFQFYKDELEQIYNSQPKNLYDWNFNCLAWVFKKMKLSPQFLDEKNENKPSKISAHFFEYTPINYINLAENYLISYTQVFQDKIGFLPNISVLDLLFNAGKGSHQLLLNAKAKLQSNSIV